MLQQTPVSESDMFRTRLHGDQHGCRVHRGLAVAARRGEK